MKTDMGVERALHHNEANTRLDSMSRTEVHLPNDDRVHYRHPFGRADILGGGVADQAGADINAPLIVIALALTWRTMNRPGPNPVKAQPAKQAHIVNAQGE